MGPFTAVLLAVVAAIVGTVLLVYMYIALFGDNPKTDQEVHFSVNNKSEDTQLLDWLDEKGLAFEFQDKQGRFIRFRARREIDQARFKDIRDALRWAREQ